MMLKLKISILLVFLLGHGIAQAQISSYKFKRDISGVNSIWHGIKLPEQLYAAENKGFQDLRIFGMTGKDTTEVPYLLKQRVDQIISKEVDFKIINKSSDLGLYYFTFQANVATAINQINLSFKQSNFDWQATLEGSNDNLKWFSILKDYRILSIKNNDTDYQFTKLSVPDSKYQYFRIALKSPVQPELLEAKILKTDTINGTYQDLKYRAYHLYNDAKAKETVITVDLTRLMPVSNLKLNVNSDFDFYRSFKIEYATDSVKTEKGMQYNYAELYNGTLSSLEQSTFNFPNTIASRIKITIQNNDNRPLSISGLELKGNIFELVARFDNPTLQYALYYGNNKVAAPNYEIEKFESKIPSVLAALTIGKEQQNPAYAEKIEKPLFENKAWLWVLMAVIIALLGWFSFKMLRN